MNLGVCISAFNEENLIRACIRPVLKIFPQVEVIDLGSEDTTIKRIRETGIEPVCYDKVSGAEWTSMKNDFAKRHDWVLFIDGDEIYTEDQLIAFKDKINSKAYDAYRIAWRNLRIQDGKFQVASLRTNGVKAYNSSKFYFKRPWPREVLDYIDTGAVKEPKEEALVWCYHGVLLKRSSFREPTSRFKKRKSKNIRYGKELEWEDIKKLPWGEKNVQKFTPDS